MHSSLLVNVEVDAEIHTPARDFRYLHDITLFSSCSEGKEE